MSDHQNCAKNGNVYTADPVPFVANENMRAQMDAANIRLVRVIVFLIVLLFGSNLFWAFVK